MTEYLETFYNAIIETSADEVMGAMMVGLALALAGYGLCALVRKRTANPLPLLCGLMFLISALSMAIGVGHSRHKLLNAPNSNRGGVANRGAGASAGPGGRSEGAPMHFHFGKFLLHRADVDHDGRLTPEEAARFVKEIDRSGKGSVDAFEIDHPDREPFAPPPSSDSHPGTPRPDPDRVDKTSRTLVSPPVTGPGDGPDQDSTGAKGPLGSSEATRSADSRSR